MGKIKYLLDTNPIIIAINNGLKLKKYKYLISFITEMELLSYPEITSDDEKEILKLLNNFKIINLNSEIKNHAIRMRRKYKLKLPDSIIVATSIVKNAILISEDKKLNKVNEINIKGLREVIDE